MFSSVKMSLLLWIISYALVLDKTYGRQNEQPVASVHLKELPTCTSETLPKAVHEWQLAQTLTKTIEWTYGHVSLAKHKF